MTFGQQPDSHSDVWAFSSASPPGKRALQRLNLCVFQTDGSMALDSDEGEEPSPEAMARYLSMRRHTVGVPDPR